MRRSTLIALLLLVASCTSVDGFVTARPKTLSRPTRLYAELTDIDKMKASEMRKELESYGISTKSLFEKSEFVAALKKARAEGKTPVNGTASANASSSTGGFGNTTNGASKKSSSDDSKGREKRYQKAFKKAQKMKVGELKKELEGRGISTKSFFEKSEFVKAYAAAVADNLSGGGGPGPRPEEPQDPSYRDVVMQKMSRNSLMGERVIDVMVR